MNRPPTGEQISPQEPIETPRLPERLRSLFKNAGDTIDYCDEEIEKLEAAAIRLEDIFIAMEEALRQEPRNAELKKDFERILAAHQKLTREYSELLKRGRRAADLHDEIIEMIGRINAPGGEA